MVLIEIIPIVIASGNKVNLIQLTVIGLSKGSFRNKTHGERLGEYNTAHTIHDDILFLGF
jgi:hypothetical protein